MLKDLDVLSREQRVTDYIIPKSLKKVSGEVVDADRLLFKRPLQISVQEKDLVSIKSEGYVILDFGKEIHGGVRILTCTVSENTKIRIRFGESLSETCSELIHNGGTATNDHSLRDFETQLVSYSDMTFGQTGFRFVRIDFLSGFEIKIKSIVGVFVHREMQRLGSFTCSDPDINKIFEVAAYTLELNMQTNIWDGIKRDRLVWIGDMHPEVMGIISLFGSDKSVEDALEFVKDLSPLPNFMNGMPSYSLWWLCIIGDYFLVNENFEFLNRNKEYIINLVKYIDNLVDASGNLNFSSFFLDWPSFKFENESKAGVHALCAYAMEKTKIIYKALNMDDNILNGIIQRLNKMYDGGTLKQVNAMKVLSNHCAPEHMIAGLLDEGAKGFSTFMSYYILSAITKAGKMNDALTLMKSYYGAMLSRGATTFFEDFSMDWLENSGRIDEMPQNGEKDLHGDYGAHCYKGFRHSLCHGWSCGPVPFLTEYVLGIKILEPGCRLIKIQPNLGSLTYAKGTFPTPHGLIEIEHRAIGGKISSKVKTPKKVKISKE